ncbi:MAG TPA: sensor histidine kinase [Chloroflexota bacterium]
MAPSSLRRQLLAWLLLPLAGVAVLNVWTGYLDALQTTDLLTERTLLASARMIAEQVHDQDGVVEALIPPSALELFVTDTPDRVVYRVIGPDGELVAGHPDVPLPPRPPDGLRPIVYDGTFRTERIREVAIMQPIVGYHPDSEAMVIVGQTLNARDRMTQMLWRKSLRDQGLLVVAAGSLALLGLHRGLAPLRRLRRALLARDPDGLAPLDPALVQHELRPVVVALNDALERLQAQIAAQRRFIANASHQLRTPLALLKTQARVGLREADSKAKDEALAGIDAGVDAITRMTTQLLSLARTEQDKVHLLRSEIDLAEVTRATLERFAERAVERRIDLGLEIADAPMRVRGNIALLGEMVGNLVDNALVHVPPGGSVTASLLREGPLVRFRLEDNGPGIPVPERERVFERFHRLLATAAEGTGLGLSIVREIVLAHGGTISLHDRQCGSGLVVSISLPAAADPVSSPRAGQAAASAPDVLRSSS